jgi:mannose-6-phosphate isomerase-like protein (cupin superfamily)
MASERFQRKSLDQPDETRTFENGKAEVVTLGDFSASRLVFEPGWRWSENVKPIAGTDSCQVFHTGYHVSGRLHVRMDDGTEEEVGPGDAYVIPPGHDAWVVGEEPVVSVDMSRATAKQYATVTERAAGSVQEGVRTLSGTATGVVGGVLGTATGAAGATAGAATGAIRTAAGTTNFPIEGYDEMNEEEISERLKDLSAEQIRLLRDYEERNKRRDTLLEQMDRKIRAT